MVSGDVVEGCKINDVVSIPPWFIMRAPCVLLIIENRRLRRCDCGTHTHTHTHTHTNHRLFLKKVGNNVKMSDQAPVFVVYFLFD
jgi:hypothetical protein